MKKFFYGFFIIIALVIIGEFVYYFASTNSSLASFFGIKTSDKSGFKILSQDKSDTLGRTVVYAEKKGAAFNGSGAIDVKNYTLLTVYVGKAEGFEKIDNSKDEYIVINDPTTGSFLGKGRIDYTSDFDKTDFRVEDLSTEVGNEVLIEGLGISTGLGKDTIHKMIQKGDVVTVMLKPENSQTWKPLIDENQVPHLTRVIIRRYGGKRTLSGELGISL